MFKNQFNRILNIRHITAYQVAKETEISQGLMNEYKNGVKMPTIQNLTKIANYLDCSVDYLLGREVTSPSDEGITLYNKLDAEDKAEVRGTMKQMLKSVKYNKDAVPSVPYGELAALGGIENPQPLKEKFETE